MWHLSDRLRTKYARAVLAFLAPVAVMWGWIGPAAGQYAAPAAQESTPGEPAWKTSPYHGVIGGDGNVIPCRCLYRGMSYRLGEKVCMQTHRGLVMTECDLQQNNTSWVPTSETCTVS